MPQPSQRARRLRLERQVRGRRDRGLVCAQHHLRRQARAWARWSEDEIAKYLKAGVAPHNGIALGPMQETIDDSLRYLTDEDLHAIAAYLKSVKPKETFANKPRAASRRPARRARRFIRNIAPPATASRARASPGQVPVAGAQRSGAGARAGGCHPRRARRPDRRAWPGAHAGDRRRPLRRRRRNHRRLRAQQFRQRRARGDEAVARSPTLRAKNSYADAGCAQVEGLRQADDGRR